MDNSAKDKSRPKQRAIAVARTSGIPQWLCKKLRERKRKREEEMAIQKRAKEVRARLFQRFGVENVSKDDSSSEDEDEMEEDKEAGSSDENLDEVDENDPKYDVANMFVKKDVSAVEQIGNIVETLEDASKDKKIPIRRTLYREGDPRNDGPDAILKCKICLAKGEMALFSSEETLQIHQSKKHVEV